MCWGTCDSRRQFFPLLPPRTNSDPQGSLLVQLEREAASKHRVNSLSLTVSQETPMTVP